MACGCLRRGADAALLAAAASGDAAGVRRALLRGASAECRDERLGGTPLALAALHGHLACLEALLLHAAPDVRAADRVGDTPLHWAALSGHAAAVALLLAHGADARDRNLDGDAPLDMAGRGVGVDRARAEAVRRVLRDALPRGFHLADAPAQPLTDDDAADFDATRVVDSSRPAGAAAAPPAPAPAPAPQVGADWQLDAKELQFHAKLASGSFGDVFRGTYRGADVAIKALRLSAGVDDAARDVLRDFVQELSVLRRVRHRHVVQLIGACAGPPACLLVTELMRGGALADHLRAHRPALPAAQQLRLALHVARGMDYLHRCSIVHRDLKSANLLLNEHGECKVADFGLARVVDGAAAASREQLTAETGTYRWMAPEVVSHARYDAKCDVYSYGIVLWEIASGGAVPYAGLSALHVALGVVQKGLRPEVPAGADATLARLMAACWDGAPAARPDFGAVVCTLEAAQLEG
jgi:hypothetical protein